MSALPSRAQRKRIGLALACSLGGAGADAQPMPGGLDLGEDVRLNAQVEAGISVDPLRQSGSNLNYGQLFTDRNDQPLLNQVLLTLHRDIDVNNPDLQVGFKLQSMYGSDARYTHFLGELDMTLGGREQLDVVEADLLVHLPVLSAGSVDVTLGQFPTLLGYEPIDPASNPFYSHSYIFLFGVPFKHTGALAQWHITPLVAITLGIDTGANTTFGRGYGDNNAAAAGVASVQVNLLGDTLVLQGISHFGPEDAARIVPHANSMFRFYNDLIVTYKPAGHWSFATEADWVHDAYGSNGSGANAGGVAQYAAYTLTETTTLNGRAELFRDDNGFFVSAYPGDLDPVRAQLGVPNGSFGVGQATYGEVTLGLTWKPTGLPAPLAGLIVRPEARYDTTLTDTKAYQGGRNRFSITLASDLIVQF